MAFLESPRLDSKITRGARSIVKWKRDKAYTASGKLSQDFRWANAKHQIDLSHGLRSNADYQTVLDFFYVVMANAHEGFRVKDWRDFIATQANSSMTLITGSTYQLQRRHAAGASVYLRAIKKPVVGTVTVYRTRAAVVTTATASIDHTTGIATISGHVGGDTYTWAGEFDIPMTFVSDEWVSELEVNLDNLHIISPEIMLEELRA